MFKISDESYDKKRFAPSQKNLKFKIKYGKKKRSLGGSEQHLTRNGTQIGSRKNSIINLQHPTKTNQFNIYQTNPNSVQQRNEPKSSVKMLKDFNF